MLKNIILISITLALSLEISSRLTGLDYILMRPLLYYQYSDQSIHELSPNPERLYQLKPNSKALTAELEHRISVNTLGFRGRERKVIKPAGVTRIICFGGSTTYGAFAGDEETFPYLLEKTLNNNYKGKFEVWNAGINAYVLSAEVSYAKEVLGKYEPDIIIFQYFNKGRRAFFPNAPYSQFFRANSQLYQENLRFIPFRKNKLSSQLLKHSAGYRTCVVLANCFLFIRGNNPEYDSETTNITTFENFYMKFGTRVPIFLLRLKTLHDYPDPQLSTMVRRTGIRELDIFSDTFLSGQNLSSEYFKVHPPAYVYRWYAKSIAQKLADYGMVEKK